MIDRCSILVAGGFLALALNNPVEAASAITAAAIATGRLYVVGSTDQPHTSVSLDGQFTTESDDKGKFQFALVYYPAGCIVRATIDGRTIAAKVERCGEICEPAPQPPAAAVSNLGPVKPALRQQPAAPAGPIRTEGMALAAPQVPETTNALPPAAPQPTTTSTAVPISDPPLPPRRPTDVSIFAAKRSDPAPAFEPTVRKLRPRPEPAQPETPGDQPNEDQPDAREGSDLY